MARIYTQDSNSDRVVHALLLVRYSRLYYIGKISLFVLFSATEYNPP
jgi:hypothetical protein